ncbi:hypothetical protein SDC9_161807 [bioreactor metagenome]|uniref:Uncharacterized protein n=1 Tax=bioreactor metagenome TaxID=1076179 RepID=A0A645FKJ3_9ZZZZ
MLHAVLSKVCILDDTVIHSIGNAHHVMKISVQIKVHLIQDILVIDDCQAFR